MPADQAPQQPPWVPIHQLHKAASRNQRSGQQRRGASRPPAHASSSEAQQHDSTAAGSSETSEQPQRQSAPHPHATTSSGEAQQEGSTAAANSQDAPEQAEKARPRPQHSASARSPPLYPRTFSGNRTARMPLGHVRPFKVKSVPQDMGEEGSVGKSKGPLLSAAEHDGDLYLVRMQQLKELGDEVSGDMLMFSVMVF